MKLSRTIKKRIKRYHPKVQALVISVVLVGVGIWVVFFTRAATQLTSYETESEQLSKGCLVQHDATASAGAAVAFTSCSVGLFDNPVAPSILGWGAPNVTRGPDGYYYSIGSQGDQRIKRSPNLYSNWSQLSLPIFTNGKSDGAPTWTNQADPHWLGTEIHYISGRWILVASFTKQVSGRLAHVVALATATAGPTGPYSWAHDQVDVYQNDENHVDPSLFLDQDKLWLLYNVSFLRDSNNKVLRAVQLNLDSLTANRTTAIDLLSTRVDSKSWENDGSGRRLEAPGMFKYNGTYFLYYAAGNPRWDLLDRYPYVVGLARSESMPPRGLFSKFSTPILDSEKPPVCQGICWKGPGHGSVIQTGNDQFYFIYQAKRGSDNSKTAFLQQLLYNRTTNWFYFNGGQIQRRDNPLPTP